MAGQCAECGAPTAGAGQDGAAGAACPNCGATGGADGATGSGQTVEKTAVLDPAQGAEKTAVLESAEKTAVLGSPSLVGDADADADAGSSDAAPEADAPDADSDSDPSPDQESDTETPLAPSSPRRRIGRRGLIRLGVVLVLLIGGIVTYEQLKPAPPSAESTVRSFFADLAADDTADALALTAPAGSSTPGAPSGTSSSAAGAAAGPLLSAAVLAAPSSRPAGVVVGAVSPQTAPDGTVTSYAVQVSYKAGALTLDQVLTVVPDQGSAGPAFRIQGALLSLRVPDPTGRPITVNGVAAGSRGFTAQVFPGSYTVSLRGNRLLSAQNAQLGLDPQAAAAAVSTTGLLATFGPAVLAPGARAAVDAQVDAALKACAASTSAAPEGCPFRVFSGGVGDRVQWTLAESLPSPTVAVASEPSPQDQVDFTAAGAPDVVSYVDRFTGLTGVAQVTSGQISYTVSGTATQAGAAVTVSFASR